MDLAKLEELTQQKVVDDINKLKKAAKTKKDADEAAAKLKFTNAKGSVANLKTAYEDAFTKQVLYLLKNRPEQRAQTEQAGYDRDLNNAKKAFEDNQKILMDNLGTAARKEAKDVNLKAFENAQKVVTDKVTTDYNASSEKAAWVAQKGVITALDTKIKNLQGQHVTLKATAKTALDAYTANPSGNGLKAASDAAAAAVTAKNGEITTEVGKMRTERTKEANLKATADAKLAALAETADKDNFDTAREELYG